MLLQLQGLPQGTHQHQGVRPRKELHQAHCDLLVDVEVPNVVNNFKLNNKQHRVTGSGQWIYGNRGTLFVRIKSPDAAILRTPG